MKKLVLVAAVALLSACGASPESLGKESGQAACKGDLAKVAEIQSKAEKLSDGDKLKFAAAALQEAGNCLKQ